MRESFGHRPLRFVFAANVISMLGSGMNSAAGVYGLWFVAATWPTGTVVTEEQLAAK